MKLILLKNRQTFDKISILAFQISILPYALRHFSICGNICEGERSLSPFKRIYEELSAFVLNRSPSVLRH